ncbi:hypothetical protein EI546_00355 [Aequorivita sp. H23M31]|uniref:Uncharacterized protein n=1 Tax=Aequorivita ciconiae TaxID=2494375 RepID=A0A451FSB1_9FLAO|nr:hypothetical protein [Aequorivita sp. H23M31]QAA80278.1 hypothetical protein EI546_00355 [Aequorivita sp. H23M31]
MKGEFFLAALFFGIISCNNSNKTSEPSLSETNLSQVDSVQYGDIPENARQIAEACGIQNWNKVSEIAFTFNVDRDGNHFERSWIWNPKSQDIKMVSSKDSVNYNRSKMDSLTMKTDAAFINDKYWLLAPFQLVWDKGMEFSTKENVVSPISKDTLSQLTIVYPNDGGYTPGDAYDFFYDKNFRIQEWNYRKENSPEPSLTSTWEDYKDFEGIVIATMHRNNSNNFKLYFTNISVKTGN